MSTATKEKAGKAVMTTGFEGFADMMDVGGLADLISDAAQDFSMIYIDEIQVIAQVRDEFEDEENTLEELAASIREHGVFQPILIRPVGGPLPFELVSGERRLRASVMAEQEKIPAIIRALTDEQAKAIQYAENVHRKNLTQVEHAKHLQAELDALGGNIEALCEKHHKSPAWVSKWLSLVNLPTQAKRLIAENVSADLEVISAVRQIEKADPQAAKALVDDLKKARGKKGENARERAKAVKDTVKPKKKNKAKEVVLSPENDQGTLYNPIGTEEDNHDFDFSGNESTTEGASNEGSTREAPTRSPVTIAGAAYAEIADGKTDAATLLAGLQESERDALDGWLHTFFSAGEQCKTLAVGVLQGFRSGNFSDDGYGALALVAFLHGAESDTQFNLLNILASVKG